MRKQRLWIWLFTCLVIIGLMALVAGCSSSSPSTSAPSAAVPASSAAVSAGKSTQLIFFHLVPEAAPVAKIAEAWGDKVTEQTGGQVTFVYYWAGTLIPPGETMKSMQAGVADVAFFPPDANFQGLSYVLLLPFMGIPSMQAGSEIFGKLLNEFPEMAAEYEGLKVMSPRMTAFSEIHTSKKAVKTLADMSGVKVRVSMDKTIADFIQAAGGTPVEVPPPDLPTALEKGVVDGVYFSFPALNNFGTIPMMPYHTMFGDTGIAGDFDVMAIRQATWDKLPADVQKVITDLAPWYQEQMIQAETNDLAACLDSAKKLNHTFTNLSADEVKPWSDIVQAMHQQWIKKMEDKGKPGQKIYNRTKELIAQYK